MRGLLLGARTTASLVTRRRFAIAPSHATAPARVGQERPSFRSNEFSLLGSRPDHRVRRRTHKRGCPSHQSSPATSCPRVGLNSPIPKPRPSSAWTAEAPARAAGWLECLSLKTDSRKSAYPCRRRAQRRELERLPFLRIRHEQEQLNPELPLRT